MSEQIEVTQADVIRVLGRAIERIMGVEIDAMGGDNLAIILCNAFDDPDGGEMDDNGWSQAATDAYEEIKDEIDGKFVPVREVIAALFRHQVERESRLVDALEWIAANYENGHMNHVDFRVGAKHRADEALKDRT